MTVLIVGLVIFLGVHSVGIVAPAWREAQIARLGPGAWKGLYSVVSAIGLGVLIYGFGLARETPVVLYAPPLWLRHAALLLLVPVFPLFVAAYFPGRIKAAAKHPMLLSVKLWALAHLLANGTLADVVLFGAFLLWAGADRVAVKRRPMPREVPGAPASAANDAIVVIVGLAVYFVVLLWAHQKLIGVSPLG